MAPSGARAELGAGGTGGGDRVFKPLADPHRERPTVALGEFSRKICDLLTLKSTHGENIKARRMGSAIEKIRVLPLEWQKQALAIICTFLAPLDDDRVCQ